MIGIASEEILKENKCSFHASWPFSWAFRNITHANLLEFSPILKKKKKQGDSAMFKFLGAYVGLDIVCLIRISWLLVGHFVNTADSEVDSIAAFLPKAALVWAFQ